MSLPAWLRPWWPLFKRLHRLVTRLAGHLFRALSPLLGVRGVPRRATASALDTATEPGVVRHAGRPEEPWVRPATVGDPADHWRFTSVHEATATSDLVPAITIPATFTLEVAGGRLSGDYAATTTPGKVLDHETNPTDPDTVWVAALGHAFGPNEERGVFKSTDGGETWRKVLHVSDKAGAVDLSVDDYFDIVGRKTAARYGWKVGDRIPLQATFMQGKDGNTWIFELVGIYDGAKKGTDTSQLFFRYDYFDEGRAFGKGSISWFTLRVADPAQVAARREAGPHAPAQPVAQFDAVRVAPENDAAETGELDALVDLLAGNRVQQVCLPARR